MTVIDKVRWTTSDLELLSQDEWKRYEIIDGELFVTRAPHLNHQDAAGNIYFELQRWSRSSGAGKAFFTPGVIFDPEDNVQPDVLWISNEKLAVLLDDSGHLTGAPELIVEVLSPGSNNERRDRSAKLKLYSSQGVQEYWIADWRLKTVEIYRRNQSRLKLLETLLEHDRLTSPLLPGFNCEIRQFFVS